MMSSSPKKQRLGGEDRHLVFAYYITGHGFGHATRVVDVVRHLTASGHQVHVVTGAPDFVFTTEIQSPNLHLRKLVLDCGAVQADALTVDRLASLEKYHETVVVPRESILATEVEWLKSIQADLVVSDVVPIACRAAADAGIRSICVTNFSWDFIYAEYVMAAGHHHRSIVWQVSFGSELSNRAPTFDMDLTDLMDGEQPLSYEKAYKYFAQDPSQKWAAYIAGTILVLMSELGVRFTDSLSILVSSAVPEGKGVSSSAAVEVATMSAIAAAYGIDIPPRDLALLCQKVENHIVGAPCGVMDQMTSACGEANKLLAMVCQPAEVKELVTIPTHIRFWGFDSGIRHSVGGTDYGSVRIGTFMGRKMIISTASSLLSRSLESVTSSQQVDGMNSDEYEEHGIELLKAESSLDYLCNLSTHRYEALYAEKLPEYILGEAFLNDYGDHNDTVTVIDPKRKYAVRAPTKHPIYENFRVETFKSLLTAATADEQLSSLGQLMYQCHYSYSDCGLGSDGTERLVRLVQEMQHRRSSHGGSSSLFGAKITGGGSGGSVCVIGRNCVRSSEEILEIQQRYKAATGYLPIIFEGSSPGAGKFGYLKLRRRPSPCVDSE